MHPARTMLLGAWATFCVTASAQATDISSATFGGLKARNIGPAVMSGRISAIDGIARNGEPTVLYIGSASGGVWKSDDGGIVYRPVFDDHIQSIGAVRIDPGAPETVWVGTGESWVRNTVSIGDGVYRSTDGGDNWQHLGLDQTEHIAEILVHPDDGDTAWVCALGQLWNGNEQRGVFRTRDAGESWEKVLFVDNDTGCSDLAMTPGGDTLYAGMWQVRRYPDFFVSGGQGSALYRSRDGGDTWERLSAGLPESELGRIAVTVAPSQPDRVYATVESENTALYRSDDGGESFRHMDDSHNVQIRPFYFGEIKVDPEDPDRVYRPAFTLTISTDGGDTFGAMFGAGYNVSIHVDHHALWINPDHPQELVLGTDGGVYISGDKGRHWRHVANLPVSQFYHVGVDNDWPYNIYGGLQDNGSWMGPSQATGGIQNKHWKNIGFGDGFWAFPDPQDSTYLYVEYQGGRLMRVHRELQELKRIQPARNDDQEELRFNWNTPVEISHGRKGVIYYGSQYLHKSTDRGESWTTISPDLTTNDPAGQRQAESGGLTVDNSTAENFTTIYTISESPRNEKVIWVGTDDGNVQLTRNGGRSWTELSSNIPGLPDGTWVSRIEASPHDKATAFATFDGHRIGDMTTYAYVTRDYGRTWQPLADESIHGYAWVIRQDPVNPELLYLGTEFGLFLSLDGGGHWARFTENLPQVAVHDLTFQEDRRDLVIATHGRGVYIIDDLTALRELDAKILEQDVAMLPTRPAVMSITAQIQSFNAHDNFTASNPPDAATIAYYLKKRHLFGEMRLEVYDGDRLITRLPAGKRRGLNRVEWPMRFKSPKFPPSTSLTPGFLGPRVPEGTYQVRLIKGDVTLKSEVELVFDPRSPHSKKDRRMQQELALELYDMLNDLTYLNDSLAEVRDGARERANALTGELATYLETYAKSIETLRASMAASKQGAGITGEEKLRERLGNLYGNVTGYDGRPSRTQFQRRDALAEELAGVREQGDALLTERLAGLNDRLQSADQRPIDYRSREKWNEDEGMTGFSGPVGKHFFREVLPKGFSVASPF